MPQPFIPYKQNLTDKDGKKVRRVFQNRIVETLLVKPSQWYIENVLEPAHAEIVEQRKDQEKKLRIQRKLTEMAEKELEEEGKL